MLTRMTQHIAIWGLGKEGSATLTWAQQHYAGAQITVIDKAPTAEQLSEEQAAEAIERKEFDLIIKSPGVSTHNVTLKRARELGTPITTSLNLWMEQHPNAKTIAITGTKGKSTTTSLLAHLLQKLGQGVAIAGNIGQPLLATTPGKDWTVIEVSSYMAADMTHAPTVFCGLNLTHADAHIKWHSTFEAYGQEKFAPLNLQPAPLGVLNAQDEYFTSNFTNRGNTQWFNQTNGWHVQSGQLRLSEQAFDVDFPLPGEHQLHNLAAALTIIDAIGLNAKDALQHTASYQPLAHRLERVPHASTTEFYNDSIATTPEASAAGVRAFNGKKLALICGGQELEQNFDTLYQALREHGQTHVYTLPHNGSRLAQEVSDQQLPATACEDLQQAIQHTVTDDAEVVLLSPGCPSFGQYNNFEERGNHFKKLVAQLNL